MEEGESDLSTSSDAPLSNSLSDSSPGSKDSENKEVNSTNPVLSDNDSVSSKSLADKIKYYESSGKDLPEEVINEIKSYVNSLPPNQNEGLSDGKDGIDSDSFIDTLENLLDNYGDSRPKRTSPDDPIAEAIQKPSEAKSTTEPNVKDRTKPKESKNNRSKDVPAPVRKDDIDREREIAKTFPKFKQRTV